MKYCSRCGAQVEDDAVVCVHCGCKIEDSPVVISNNSGLDVVIKVFMIIGTVLRGLFIVPLAWCIPIAISVFDSMKNRTPISVGMKVCVLLLVNFVAGICLLFR